MVSKVKELKLLQHSLKPVCGSKTSNTPTLDTTSTFSESFVPFVSSASFDIVWRFVLIGSESISFIFASYVLYLRTN